MKRFIGNQKGQVLILMALALVVLFGFTALAVDVGMISYRKSALQNACDAAALAGAQELLKTEDKAASKIDAKAVAIAYAQDNGVENPVVSFPDDYKITVYAEKQVGLFFARVLGKNQSNIASDATAAVVAIEKTTPGTGLRPFGVVLKDTDRDGIPDETPDYVRDYDYDGNGSADDFIDDPVVTPTPTPTLSPAPDDDKYDFYEYGEQVTLREGPGDGLSGNFEYVDLSGGGYNNVRDVIKNGSDNSYEVFDTIYTQTGVAEGQADQGIEHLIDYCVNNDIWDDPDKHCTWDDHKESCWRVVVVPIIYSLKYTTGKQYPDDANTGNSQVVIVGFAKFFIESYEKKVDLGDGTKGMTITGRFIEDVTKGFTNPSHESLGAMGVKLID